MMNSITKPGLREVIGMHIFSDSTIALYWVTGRVKQDSLRGNRSIMNMIQKIAEEKQANCQDSDGETCSAKNECVLLKRIRTGDNLAGLATRGILATKLMSNDSLWWSRPN